MNHKYIHIAIYLRVSAEDRDTNNEENSKSILNQKKLILSYINDNEEFENFKITEFIDDGYSGMDSERPGFKSMIKMAEQKQIDVIITKDYSRLGRDYLSTGKYIEYIFPLLGVRYISINDEYDSRENLGKTQNLDAGIKGILNMLYCKDLSVKIKAAQKTLLEEKKYVSGIIPFGYRKSNENKYKLVIDPEAATIVREIFNMALDGYGIPKIVLELNEQYCSILDYYDKKGKGRKKSIYEKGCKRMWTSGTVRYILHNEVYTGKIIANKYTYYRENGKRKRKTNDRRTWNIKENCHEAIIPQNIFDKVQSEIASRNRIYYGVSPLKGVTKKRGFILCGYCGRSMANPKREKNYKCTLHHIIISKSKMEKAVLNSLNLHDDMIDESNKKLYNQTINEKNSIDIVESIDVKLKKLHKQKFDIYNHYICGKISKEELMIQKNNITEQISICQSEREVQESILLQIKMQNDISSNPVALNVLKKFTTFNRDELEKVINSIVVHSEQEIEICWKTKESEKILLE